MVLETIVKKDSTFLDNYAFLHLFCSATWHVFGKAKLLLHFIMLVIITTCLLACEVFRFASECKMQSENMFHVTNHKPNNSKRKDWLY